MGELIAIAAMMVPMIGLLAYVEHSHSGTRSKLDSARDTIVDLKERVATRDATIGQYAEKAKDDEHVMGVLEQDRDRLQGVVRLQSEQYAKVLKELDESALPVSGPLMAQRLRQRLQDVSALSGPDASTPAKNG